MLKITVTYTNPSVLNINNLSIIPFIPRSRKLKNYLFKNLFKYLFNFFSEIIFI